MEFEPEGRAKAQTLNNGGEGSMRITELSEYVANDAALRRRQRLQPVGGKGDKIFPPTYPGGRNNPSPRHIFERRRVDGRELSCVLVDSVQSQANRLEESLMGLIADGAVNIPHVVVDFSDTGLVGISKITSPLISNSPWQDGHLRLESRMTVCIEVKTISLLQSGQVKGWSKKSSLTGRTAKSYQNGFRCPNAVTCTIVWPGVQRRTISRRGCCIPDC